MPDTLTRALRDVIDASAEPVTVEEVLGLPVVALPSRRRLPVMLAAAAVVLAAVVGGLVLAGQGGDGRSPVANPAADVEVPPLTSCVVHENETGGCPVTDEQAAAMLGFDINHPDGIPEGWTLVNHEVRAFVTTAAIPTTTAPAGERPEPQEEQPRESVVDYNRSWFADPAEADPEVVHCLALSDACIPDYVQVNVRRALPGEDGGLGPVRAQLDDGTPVYGTGSYAMQWVADGRYYRIRSWGIDEATALRIASSLA